MQVVSGKPKCQAQSNCPGLSIFFFSSQAGALTALQAVEFNLGQAQPIFGFLLKDFQQGVEVCIHHIHHLCLAISRLPCFLGSLFHFLVRSLLWRLPRSGLEHRCWGAGLRSKIHWAAFLLCRQVVRAIVLAGLAAMPYASSPAPSGIKLGLLSHSLDILRLSNTVDVVTLSFSCSEGLLCRPMSPALRGCGAC